MVRSIFELLIYGKPALGRVHLEPHGACRHPRFGDSALEFSGVFGFGLGLSDFGLM